MNTLSSHDIAEGMNAAARNSRDLAADARLLLENHRYSRALALAILSIEESGKNGILRSIATADSNEELKNEWKRFRSHKAKNAHWLLIELALKGARKVDDFRPMFDKSSNHSEFLDKLKQDMFYVKFTQQNEWTIPEEVVNKDFAAALVSAAEFLSDKKEHTEKEIDFWRAHMRNTQHLTLAEQKEALRCWYKDMEDAGLFKEGKITLNEFLGD